MSVAARASRLAVVASLAAAVSFSVGGLTSPRSVQATESQSVQATESQSVQAAESQAVQAKSSRSAKAGVSQRTKIVHIVTSHIGAQYKFGAEGAKGKFDCSGLVYAVYKEAGLIDKIGGARKGARGYYHWFKRRGLASRSNPKPGDLVIWHKGKHVGIYIGDGRIVSAVNRKYDVREHGLSFVSGFTAYLHVNLHGQVPEVPATDVNKTVKTTAHSLKMRTGPGMAFSGITKVHRGTTIKVTAKAFDSKGRRWFKGELPSGKIGWVKAWLVRTV